MKSRNYKYLGFHDFWFRIIGIPFLGFLIPIVFFGNSLDDGFGAYMTQWLEGSFYSLLYWEGTRLILINIRKQYPNFEDARKRILLQVIIVLFYAGIISILSRLIFNFLFLPIRGPEEHPPTGAIGIFGVIFLMMSLYESIYFYYQLKLSIEEREKAKREHLRSELEGLRNQVNPHFLFNSLNTLMNIVSEDQNLAIHFLKKLSKVYRYVLESRQEPLIALKEELDFMESYIFLQKERFQSNLVVEVEIPEAFQDYQIIPLATQILFENAIKHNIVSSKHPLHIRIFINPAHKLVVQNNLQRKKSVLHSTKVGLENVQTRYRIFTHQKVDIAENEQYFSVALPLIRSDVSRKIIES